ncbi:hypothetical protein HMI54_002737 [Coelomomyces lativittatus]|nr:hypothetical protein HMI56_000965 [Coelomomyces lativittatus]KAJ1509008.1 hypothetical protein HMI54_002737 [Coelomomyces lativittatus]KAJ1510473.1 hypothetical protein HMI55_006982 [Coelomomyces lativittatus]
MTETLELQSLENYLEEIVSPLEGILDEDFKATRPKLNVFLNGVNGDFSLNLVPDTTEHEGYLPLTNLPLGLGEDFAFPQDLKKELEEAYLLPPTHFPLTLIEKTQGKANLKKEVSIQDLFQLKPLPPQVQLEPQWNVLTGDYIRSSVVPLQGCLSDPSTPTSSLPSEKKDMPGSVSFDSSESAKPFIDSTYSSFNFENDLTSLVTIPPGLDRGIMLPETMESEDSTFQSHSLLDIAMKPILTLETDLLQPLAYDENEHEYEMKDENIEEKDVTGSSSQPSPVGHVETTMSLLSLTPPTKNSWEATLDEVLPTSTSDSSNMTSTSLVKKKKTSKDQVDWAYEVTDPMIQFDTLVPDMAISFPFTLDVFQKQAVYHLEQGHSVFVAAHTSAGKTVVAEYAIGLSQLHRTKTIYTSPIKALSNQKFRDLSSKFNVGLLTGDIQLNPQGDCLIMTTEILRSMLYKNASLLRDVEFVIFDEVHYVNDMDRGVVWEEVIILLPPHVTLILLSATVPNVKEFAGWVGRTHQKPVYVISTVTRPVPLEHYVYIPSAKEYIKVVDAKQRFLEEGWKSVMSKFNKPKPSSSSHSNTSDASKTNTNKTFRKQGGHMPLAKNSWKQSTRPERNTFVNLTYLLQDRGLLPSVIFTFSRKNCEVYVDYLSSMDLLTQNEKASVHVFVQKSITKLTVPDQTLPQILRMKDMLQRGLGVHHGGLLPIVKEMVEILFAKGLVKILFATETFAMGVNMPAKCVVFSSTRKNDGTQFRELLPGEYIQMSGRAGRRGLDATGIVLVLAMTPPVVTDFYQMVLGTPIQLRSQFRLTFTMILNLLRTSSFQVEDMMKQSFLEHETMQGLPSKQQSLETLTHQLNKRTEMTCSLCQEDLHAYHEVSEKLIHHQTQLLMMASTLPVGMKTLSPGRVLVIRTKKWPHVVGMVTHRFSMKKFMVIVLATSSLEDTHDLNEPTPPSTLSKAGGVHVKLSLPPSLVMVPPLTSRTVHTLTVGLTDVAWVTQWTVPMEDMKQRSYVMDHLYRYAMTLQSSGQSYAMAWEKKIKDLDFHEHLDGFEGGLRQLTTFTCLHCPDLMTHYAWYHDQTHLETQWHTLNALVGFQHLTFLPEYHTRLSILQRLQYVDPQGRVLLKGRVACELHSVDALVFTELLFDNFFGTLTIPEIIAMISLFVCQEKSVAQCPVNVSTENLQQAWDQLDHVLEHLRQVIEVEHGLSLPTSNSGLMDVTYAWAQGISFQQIMTFSNGVLEGSIVRTILRIEETCREVKDAARLMGDASLYMKMQEASTAIKRDIVFCGSLYFE